MRFANRIGIIAITGLAELCAAAVASSWGPEAGARALWISGAVSVAFGGLLWWSNRRKKDERPADFHRREALAAVGIGWAVAVVFGALPFLLDGAIPDLADAIFESASGFTTTGASILSGDRIDGLSDGDEIEIKPSVSLRAVQMSFLHFDDEEHAFLHSVHFL
mgnify:CR=1 FL=1